MISPENRQPPTSILLQRRDDVMSLLEDSSLGAQAVAEIRKQQCAVRHALIVRFRQISAERQRQIRALESLRRQAASEGYTKWTAEPQFASPEEWIDAAEAQLRRAHDCIRSFPLYMTEGSQELMDIERLLRGQTPPPTEDARLARRLTALADAIDTKLTVERLIRLAKPDPRIDQLLEWLDREESVTGCYEPPQEFAEPDGALRFGSRAGSDQAVKTGLEKRRVAIGYAKAEARELPLRDFDVATYEVAVTDAIQRIVRQVPPVPPNASQRTPLPEPLTIDGRPPSPEQRAHEERITEVARQHKLAAESTPSKRR
jgi:hypothetical protein